MTKACKLCRHWRMEVPFINSEDYLYGGRGFCVRFLTDMNQLTVWETYSILFSTLYYNATHRFLAVTPKDHWCAYWE
jgi:hypothetical protein